ncbi:FKBP-type peptidyl-prolyl cis-trans isomerase [Oleiharenicola sp. Vm1]|uniref:FKBP-type peptidyl-prolyl cis-trans isomerase n=1 Tax=Oleiharenicola sp. Vm1 TaxID=3398393 RepID=UPI0039F645F6
MKFTSQLSAGLASLGLLVAVSAQAQAPVKFELPQVGSDAKQAPATPAPAAQTPAAQPAAPAAPAVTFSEAQLMEAYGYTLGARMNLRDLEFTPAQIEAMAKGMTEAATGKELTYDAQQLVPQLQALLQKKQQTLMNKIRTANQANTAEFFTKLKENKNVKELSGSNGLRYEVVKEGKGQIAKEGQVAKIHLVGAFTNGQVFESTLQQQQQGAGIPEPVDVLVKSGTNAPEGLILALKNMPVGAKWRLYVPPHLAYGDDGAPGIPPAATLIFEVEVFGVADAPAETEAKK